MILVFWIGCRMEKFPGELVAKEPIEKEGVAIIDCCSWMKVCAGIPATVQAQPGGWCKVSIV